jgi:hypothetical protein
MRAPIPAHTSRPTSPPGHLDLSGLAAPTRYLFSSLLELELEIDVSRRFMVTIVTKKTARPRTWRWRGESYTFGHGTNALGGARTFNCEQMAQNGFIAVATCAGFKRARSSILPARSRCRRAGIARLVVSEGGSARRPSDFSRLGLGEGQSGGYRALRARK